MLSLVDNGSHFVVESCIHDYLPQVINLITLCQFMALNMYKIYSLTKVLPLL